MDAARATWESYMDAARATTASSSTRPPNRRQNGSAVETAAMPPMPPKSLKSRSLAWRGARVKFCSYGLGLDPAALRRHEGVDLVDVG